MNSSDSPVRTLRAYKGPWRGQLLLVCRKCRKKLKDDDGKGKTARLSKKLARLARRGKETSTLYVIDTPCLKMCPKGGVTVCTAEQVANSECSILRSKRDVARLFALYNEPRDAA